MCVHAHVCILDLSVKGISTVVTIEKLKQLQSRAQNLESADEGCSVALPLAPSVSLVRWLNLSSLLIRKMDVTVNLGLSRDQKRKHG